jgi:hypothetical protein
MDRDDVLALSRVVSEPAVSIMMPVRRAAPFHDADRRHLQQLVDKACDLVLGSYPAAGAEPLVKRLRAVVDELDFAHPGDGVAVFADADESHVLHLPFTVDEQLSIERVFATRQVLIGMAHLPPVRVLALSEHLVRLFEDRDGHLVEVHDAGFPMIARPVPEQEPPHGDLPRHEDVRAEEHRSACRAADSGLDALVGVGAIPVVVVGAERELAYFDAVSHHRRIVIGQVHGNYIEARPDELEQLVRPVIDAWVDALEDAAVREITDAPHRDRVVTDFPEVWQAAMEGRGHRLVIEDDFTYPLHLTDGYAPGDEHEEPWTLDDAVDELIEHVLIGGGDVTFVRAGKLDAAGGIGLVLRY